MMVSAPEYRFPCYRNQGFLRQEYPNWNYDLFLWQTPAVFETEDFRGGATKILSEVLKLLK